MVPFSIAVLEEQKTIRICYPGKVTHQILEMGRRELMIALQAKGWNRLLVDFRQSEVNVSRSEIYQVMEINFESLPPGTRVATLSKPDRYEDLRQYSRSIAKANQRPLAHFTDESEALDWLGCSG